MRKKGAALLAVVIVMSIAFMLSAIIVDRSLKSSRRISDTLNDRRAYYYAESLIYDMAAYISSSNNAVPKGTFVSEVSNPKNIKILSDPGAVSYKVTLASDVVKTYESAEEIEYTYNIEAVVNYKSRKYGVKMQIATRFAKGNTLVYSSHRINSRRAYKF